MPILITVLDLEREPLEFSETVPPGAIDYGSGIRQIDGMPVSGRADLITEHRVATIKSMTSVCAPATRVTSRCPAPAVWILWRSGWKSNLTCFFALPGWMRMPRNTPSRPRIPKSGTMKEAVLRSRTFCVSRCYSPCRQERSASRNAKVSALAVDGIAIMKPVLVIQARSMRGGQRLPISAAG